MAFHSREDLADPDRATTLAVATLTTRPPRRHLPVLVAVAATIAAVLAVVGVSVTVADRQQGPLLPSTAATPRPAPSAPSGGSTDPATSGDTDAINRALGLRQAAQSVAAVPIYPGATSIDGQDAGPLRTLNTYLIDSTATYAIRRSRFLFLPVDPATKTEEDVAAVVARWYQQHPPQGYRASGVGSSQTSDAVLSPNLTYTQEHPPKEAHTSILVQTAGDPGGVVFRITSFTTWLPARSPASNVTAAEVSSIQLLKTPSTSLPGGSPSARRMVTITDPRAVAVLVATYDSLPGSAGSGALCPFKAAPTFTVRFHLAVGGTLQTHWSGGGCDADWSVTRDGSPITPALGQTARTNLLGLVRHDLHAFADPAH